MRGPNLRLRDDRFPYLDSLYAAITHYSPVSSDHDLSHLPLMRPRQSSFRLLSMCAPICPHPTSLHTQSTNLTHRHVPPRACPWQLKCSQICASHPLAKPFVRCKPSGSVAMGHVVHSHDGCRTPRWRPLSRFRFTSPPPVFMTWRKSSCSGPVTCLASTNS